METKVRPDLLCCCLPCVIHPTLICIPVGLFHYCSYSPDVTSRLIFHVSCIPHTKTKKAIVLSVLLTYKHNKHTKLRNEVCIQKGPYMALFSTTPRKHFHYFFSFSLLVSKAMSYNSNSFCGLHLERAIYGPFICLFSKPF